MFRSFAVSLQTLVAWGGRPMRYLSIRAKVMIVPVAAVLGFLLYALFSVNVAQGNAALLDGFASRTFPVLERLATVNVGLVEVESTFLQAMGDQDEFLVEDAADRAGEIRGVIRELAEVDDSAAVDVESFLAAFDNYVKLSAEAVGSQIRGDLDLSELQELAASKARAYAELRQQLRDFEQARSRGFAEALTGASSRASGAAAIGMVLVLLLAGLVLLASLFVDYAIRGPIESLREVIRRVSTGDFSARVGVEGRDSITAMCEDFSALLASLNAAISESNAVLAAVARGDFDKRVEADLPGDLATLKTGVNDSADSVAYTMAALERVMASISEGDFSARMDSAVKGEFRAKVDGAMRDLQQALQALRTTMTATAQGDFSHRIELPLRGELAELKGAVNDSLAALAMAFGEIRETAGALERGDLTRRAVGEFGGELAVVTASLNSALDTLATLIRGLRLSADEVGAGAAEIAGGNADLSARTERQAAALEESASRLMELLSQMREAEANSRKTMEVTRSTAERAQAGSEVVGKAVGSMAAITQASEQVAQITGLIDSIAFQTNLLALNAAVEAARAGEQGRGFAVVAAEIRSLAQRTATSAKEISTLIAGTVERVREGNKLVTESGSLLQEVAASSRVIAELADAAVLTSRTQAEGLHSVSEAVSELEVSNQQNSALVEEVAAASSALSDQSGALRNAVTRFRLAGDGTGATVAFGHRHDAVVA